MLPTKFKQSDSRAPKSLIEIDSGTKLKREGLLDIILNKDRSSAMVMICQFQNSVEIHSIWKFITMAAWWRYVHDSSHKNVLRIV